MNWEDVNPKYGSCLRDESHLTGTGEKICFPETPEEAAEAVRSAGAGRLTVQGGRTGLSGGAVPEGGWILNLSRLTAMEEVTQAETPEVTVQTGVTLEQLQKTVGRKKLFFPPGPTEASATLGGMFATDSAGPNRLRYGSTGDWVKGLQWLTPQGKLWEITRGQYVLQGGLLPLPDGRALSLSQQDGLDLIDLLAGSEGKLGAALRLRLELLPLPGDLWGVVFFFRESRQAVTFGEKLARWRRLQSGGPVELAAAEFYNGEALAILQQNSSHPLLAHLAAFPREARAAVYLELESPETEASGEALLSLLDLFDSCGGGEADSWAENGAAAVQRFRDLRHGIPTLLGELPCFQGPEGLRYEGDFAGPAHKFPEYLELFTRILTKYDLKAVIYGSLLENRLRLALRPEDRGEDCSALLRELELEILQRGGKIAAEYGEGRRKLPALQAVPELPEPEALRKLQDLLDPLGRFRTGGEKA